MFGQTWRAHWGLREEPFVHEDADRDPILERLDAAAVHSAFDRLVGDPGSPAPGIVFGQKGSGKSALRRAILRRLAQAAAVQGDGAPLVVEYIEFDSYLECLRRRLPVRVSPERLLAAHGPADHLDAILSLAVTRTVNRLASDAPRARRLNARAKRDLLCLGQLLLRPYGETRQDALARLRRALGLFPLRARARQVFWLLGGLIGLALSVAPHAPALGPLHRWFAREPGVWTGLGLLLAAVCVGIAAWTWTRTRRVAARAVRSVRVVDGDPLGLARHLAGLSGAALRDCVLPAGPGHLASRYAMLQRLTGVLEGAGFSGLFVLVDRLDESSALGAHPESLVRFCQGLFARELLGHERLALKLFVPLEVSRRLAGSAGAELRRLTQERQHAVQELRWSGQDLLEVAGRRLRVASAIGGDRRLDDFFCETVTESDVRSALADLGTPGMTLGFLDDLFSAHQRDLPDDLPATDQRWLVPRTTFERYHAAWRDRARASRRNSTVSH